VWVANYLSGYRVVSGVDTLGYSNPIHKQVISGAGLWMQNYGLYPMTVCAPVLGFVGAFIAFLTASWGQSRIAFIFSSLSIMGVIGTMGVSMFPFILPSSTNLASSLLVWDASSSQLTLIIMLAAVIIFLPIILLYTAWVYRALRGKVDGDMIANDESHTMY
jgi:cytochrome d ubiquinol oxidase subunit II